MPLRPSASTVGVRLSSSCGPAVDVSADLAYWLLQTGPGAILPYPCHREDPLLLGSGEIVPTSANCRSVGKRIRVPLYVCARRWFLPLAVGTPFGYVATGLDLCYINLASLRTIRREDALFWPPS